MSPEFQHILRVLNTNIEGKRKVMFAMTKITGIGRRFSNIICKKAEIDVLITVPATNGPVYQCSSGDVVAERGRRQSSLSCSSLASAIAEWSSRSSLYILYYLD